MSTIYSVKRVVKDFGKGRRDARLMGTVSTTFYDSVRRFDWTETCVHNPESLPGQLVLPNGLNSRFEREIGRDPKKQEIEIEGFLVTHVVSTEG